MKDFVYLLLLLVAFPLALGATPSPDDYCHEVEQIVNAAVHDGLLSESDAEALTVRCYDSEI